MESRVNYTVVGLFVIFLAAGLIYFVYWLGTHGGEEDYDFYRVYMTESVSGLSGNAAVKYMGVGVGNVQSITIDPENPRRVELVLRIRRGTPVTTDTTAQLKFFGITGLAFVELKGGRPGSKPLVSKDGKMPVIRSKPSTLRRVDEALSVLAEKSETVLERIDRLLCEENLAEFSGLLKEVRLLSSDLRKQIPRFSRLAEHTVVTEDEIRDAARRVSAASDSVKEMSDAVSAELKDLGGRFDKEARESLNQLDALFVELQALAADVRLLVQELARAPGDVLFKRSTPMPGPGEPGYRRDK